MPLAAASRLARLGLCAACAAPAASVAVVAVVGSAAPVAAQPVADLQPQVLEFVVISSPHVVIRDVRLIDGTGGPARTGMSVEIRDGRITGVGTTSEIGAPGGAEIVDGTGSTLTPGFVMLHEHLFYPSGQARYNTNEISFPPLYLAGGVTTMRTGGSVDTYTDLRVAQHVEEGRVAGPHMDVTGPYLEGPGGFVRAMPQLATPEQARAHVDFWMDQGVTSFKAYNLIDRATLAAAIEAAHARGAKVTGHLCSITYREAADLGIDNLEHGFFAATDWVADKEPDVCPRGGNQTYLALDLDGRDFTGLVDHLVSRGVALTSTLTVVERRAAGRPAPPVGAQEAMLPQLRERVMASLERAGEGRAGEGNTPRAICFGSTSPWRRRSTTPAVCSSSAQTPRVPATWCPVTRISGRCSSSWRWA